MTTTPHCAGPGHLDGETEFISAYVDTGLVADLRRHGVKQLLLAPDRPCAPGAQNATAGGHSISLRASQTASFIGRLQKMGVVIDVTGVANEPGCWQEWQNAAGATVHADWPAVNDTSGNFVRAVTLLTAALAAEGIHGVKVVGPESSNADGHGLAAVEACRADPACWAGLGALASHSYGMAANEEWANATTNGKGYWMTEAGAWATLNTPEPFPGNSAKYQGVALACRFLSDLNHMVDTWVWFIGAWKFDTQMLGAEQHEPCPAWSCGTTRQEDMKLISTCPTKATGKECYASNASYQLLPQYHYAKQLRAAFDIGCTLRYATANTTKTDRYNHTFPFLPDMVWTYGVKNVLNVAVGQNPGGSWAVGIANPTGIPTVEDLNGVETQLFPNATVVSVELRLDDLGGGGGAVSLSDLTFTAFRSTGAATFSVAEPAVAMHGGIIVVQVGPNELLTLRSTTTTPR